MSLFNFVYICATLFSLEDFMMRLFYGLHNLYITIFNQKPLSNTEYVQLCISFQKLYRKSIQVKYFFTINTFTKTNKYLVSFSIFSNIIWYVSLCKSREKKQRCSFMSSSIKYLLDFLWKENCATLMVPLHNN